jgi:hypothetical protein
MIPLWKVFLLPICILILDKKAIIDGNCPLAKLQIGFTKGFRSETSEYVCYFAGHTRNYQIRYPGLSQIREYGNAFTSRNKSD